MNKPLSKQKALRTAQRWADEQLRKYDSIGYLCFTLHEKLILDWSGYWRKINRAQKTSINGYLVKTLRGEICNFHSHEIAILTRFLILQDFINDTYPDK